jgi:hypothetical protein
MMKDSRTDVPSSSSLADVFDSLCDSKWLNSMFLHKIKKSVNIRNESPVIAQKRRIEMSLLDLWLMSQNDVLEGQIYMEIGLGPP